MFTHTSDFQLQRAATESWTHFGRQMPVFEVVNGTECWLMLWLVVWDTFTANVWMMWKRVASEQHQITDNALKFKVKSAKADMLRSPSTFQNRSNMLVIFHLSFCPPSAIMRNSEGLSLFDGRNRSEQFLSWTSSSPPKSRPEAVKRQSRTETV